MKKAVAVRALRWGLIPVGVVLAVIIGAVAAGVLLGGESSSARLLGSNLVIFSVALGLIVAADSLIRKRLTAKKDFGLTHLLRWKEMAYGLGGLALYLIVMMALVALGKALLPMVDWQQPQELGVSTAIFGVERLIAFIALVIVVPVVEEMIFRGYLYTRLREAKMPLWLTMVVVSIVFAVIHGQVNVAVDVFVLSMVACLLRHITGTIWPGILIHMMKNLLAFYAVFMIAS